MKLGCIVGIQSLPEFKSVMGPNLFEWTDPHGGLSADSHTVIWIFDGRMITDINVYHNGRYITGLQGMGLI